MRPITKAAIAVVPAAVLVGGLTIGQATANSTAPNLPGKPSFQRATIPPRVFAVINADGTKKRGKAVASVAKLGTGTYDVRFNRNISGCAWTGTIGFGDFSGSTGPSEISVNGRAGTNNGLFVQTFAGSTGSDLPFTVLVVCS